MLITVIKGKDPEILMSNLQLPLNKKKEIHALHTFRSRSKCFIFSAVAFLNRCVWWSFIVYGFNRNVPSFFVLASDAADHSLRLDQSFIDIKHPA